MDHTYECFHSSTVHMYNFDVLVSHLSGNIWRMSAVEGFREARRFFMSWKWNGKRTLSRCEVWHCPPPPTTAHHSKSLGYMGNGGLRYISLVLYHPFATIIMGRQPHRVWLCRSASRDRPHLSPLRLASRTRQATHTHTHTHTHKHKECRSPPHR